MKWLFGGIGVLVITAIAAIPKIVYRMATAKTKKDDKEITVNVRAKSAPKIIIKSESQKCRIYQPEHYSGINS